MKEKLKKQLVDEISKGIELNSSELDHYAFRVSSGASILSEKERADIFTTYAIRKDLLDQIMGLIDEVFSKDLDNVV